MLRFAVVTDIHYGFDRGNKRGSKAPWLIERFVRAANRNRVDFAVDMGDRVTYTSRDRDGYYLGQLKEKFNQLAMPKHSVNGNHDVTYLTPEENAQILNLPVGSYSRDIGDYHVIFWSPSVRISGTNQLFIKPDEMQWLRDTLNAMDRKCIIFNHIPLDNFDSDNQAATEHDKRPFISYYPQGPEVRKILEDSGKVVLSMSGHRHRNRHREINGIHYITHQSLVQHYGDGNRAHGAYSIATLDGDRIQIKGYGHSQPYYDLKIVA